VALMPGLAAAAVPRAGDVTGHIARDLSRLLAAELVERREELAQRVTHGRLARTAWDEVVTAAILDRVPPPSVSVALRS
jgi:hypothetical protein